MKDTTVEHRPVVGFENRYEVTPDGRLWSKWLHRYLKPYKNKYWLRDGVNKESITVQGLTYRTFNPRKNVYHRPIPTFTDYLVTQEGDVWSTRHKMYLRPHNVGKHLAVSLYRDDQRPYTMMVHRIVMATYQSAPLNGVILFNHRDGNPHNNATWNLEWSYHIPRPVPPERNRRPVFKLRTESETVVKEFKSIAEAARSIDRHYMTLYEHIDTGKPYKGFIWTRNKPTTK